MRPQSSKNNDQNFWISYADLMAGLLFVFILVLGAIVVKYIFIQNDLNALKNDLIVQKTLLERSTQELEQKKRDVSLMSDENSYFKHILDDTNASLMQTQVQLLLSLQQIEELNTTLQSNLMALNEARGELLTSDALAQEAAQQLLLKDATIAELNTSLMQQIQAHNALITDLNMTKARIQNLTGIRLKVVQELKNTMGNSIHIDPNSGAIRLPSSVLFDVGSFEIKPEAKKQLRETLEPYFGILLNDASIRENVDKIIIEGHTDSDGSYMYNLDLSQKRALAVMAFIYSWDEKQNPLLQRYLSAQGRSYSDHVLKNGAEDKEASRRIEIKFSISNKKAIEEIEGFLKR